jgi:hypothetical protein
VFHEQFKGFLKPVDWTYYAPGGLYVPPNARQGIISWGNGYIDYNTFFPPPAQSELDACGAACFQQWTEAIPTVISLANFLYELKDLPGMIRNLWHVFVDLNKLFNRNSTPLKVAKFGANQALGVNYGWLPFISDLKKLATVLKVVMNRIQHLKRTYKKWTKIHFHRTLAPRDFPVRPKGLDPGNSGLDIRWSLTEYKATFNASAYYWHDFEGLNDEFTTLKAFWVAFGLDNPARVLWNAIPYSFVVEWFVRLSDVVDRLRINQFSGHVRLENVCYSYTQTGKVQADAVFYREDTLNRNEWHPTGWYECRRFMRSPGLPVAASSLFSLPDPKQQALLGAMILQRI